LNFFNDGANVLSGHVVADGGNRSLTGVFLGASIRTDRARNMIQCLIEIAARSELKVAIEPARYPRPLRPHPYIESRLAVGRLS
jgi:NADPH2:quinone reductase